MKQRVYLGLLSITFAICATGMLRGDTVHLQYADSDGNQNTFEGPGQWHYIYHNNNVGSQAGDFSGSAGAGAYWNYVVPPSSATEWIMPELKMEDPGSEATTIGQALYNSMYDEFNGPYQLFCIDLSQRPSEGSVGQYPSYTGAEYEIVDPAFAPVPEGNSTNHPMGAARRDWLRLLAQEYWNKDFLIDDTSYTLDKRFAALQLAIWEIIYEGQTGNDIPDTWSVASGAGDFYAGNTDAATLANSMLAHISSGNVSLATGPDAIQLGAFVNDDYQDMLFISTRRVPEPTGLTLAALGLLGLVSRRRKRS